MYYPDRKEYITFVFSLLDAFAETKQARINRGSPKTYSDVSLSRLLCDDDAEADKHDPRTAPLVIHASGHA